MFSQAKEETGAFLTSRDYFFLDKEGLASGAND